MQNLDSVLPFLQCPQCRNGNLFLENESMELCCKTCLMCYPISHGRPVLLRSDNGVFCIEEYRRASSSPPSTNYIQGSIARLIPTPSINLASERVLTRLKLILSQTPSAFILVVGGGRQREWLNKTLGGEQVRFIYSDVDVSADVDLFCDGYDLPFVDNTFAVLEHVMYPERAASEIYRVLKIGGLLYSELPFMQQVHEGAYDFTRYTLSGHRRLFNGFAEIESGMVAGPATALVWAIENLVLAFFSRPLFRNVAKTMVRFSFFWLKYLDIILVHRPEGMDGASCTYLLGSKIEGRIPDAEIIAGYVGAKHLRHT